MNLDLLENQKNILNFFINAKNKDRLSHAYIFEGEKGVGKNELAHFFACLMYSSNEVDYTSNSSHKILNDEFLNLYVIDEPNIIKKEKIQALQEEFSKTSQIKGPRIYIINNAEKMNIQSQNSLLKFIEEPVENIYGILCTTNSKAILSTIISRCQIIRLNSLSNKAYVKNLVKNGVDKENAVLISYLTNDINEALKFLKNAEIMKLFDIFKDFFKIKNDKEVVIYFNKNINFLSADRNNLIYYIDLLIILYNDLVYLHTGNLNLKLNVYVSKYKRLMDFINKNEAIRGLNYLYECLKMVSSTNVSCKNIVTGLMFNLFRGEK